MRRAAAWLLIGTLAHAGCGLGWQLQGRILSGGVLPWPAAARAAVLAALVAAFVSGAAVIARWAEPGSWRERLAGWRRSGIGAAAAASVRWFATAAAAAAVGASVSAGAWNVTGTWRLNRALTRLQTQGVGLAYPPRPIRQADGLNAVTWIQRAVILSRELYERDEFRRPLRGFVIGTVKGLATGEDRLGAEAAAAAGRDAIEAVRRMREASYVDWNVDWSDLVQVEERFNSTVAAIIVARLLATHATVEALNGRTLAAARAVDDGLALARVLHSHPSLIGHSIAEIATRVALWGAEAVLPALRLEEVDEAWTVALTPKDLVEAYRRSLHYDTVSVIDYLLGGGVLLRAGWAAGPFADGWRRHDYARYVAHIAERARSWRLPYHEGRRIRDRLDERAVWTMRSVVEEYTPTGERTHRTAVRLALMRAAVAVKRHRHATGRWPSSLAECAGTVPAEFADPYGTGDFHVAPLATGVVIYSVGPNGRDDGGAPLDSGGEAGDIRWVLR